MMEPLRTISLPTDARARREALVSREWLVTNGNGGYASGTLGNVPTRRYHGFLVASMPAPLGRTVMLTEIAETLELPDGSTHPLTGDERVGGELNIPGVECLQEFRLEMGLPVWRYRVGPLVVERRIFMPHRRNSTLVSYRLLEGDGPVRLRLRPAVSFRSHEDPVSTPLWERYRSDRSGRWVELTGDPDLPTLRLCLDGDGGSFEASQERITERLYRVEDHRGYAAAGELWSPGHFRVELETGRERSLIASTEPLESFANGSVAAMREDEVKRRRTLLETAPPAARSGVLAELVLAADAFVVEPAYRTRERNSGSDTAGADTSEGASREGDGERTRTVIAGYHWFSDWGRDTMIALEGLTLCTGRSAEARHILRAFASYTRDGLIPNLFPERSEDGLYHTADASLWFFHALHRYLRATGDRETLREILPALRSIVECHLRGTRFGIRIDPDDGLMTQGEEGYQLTWMDAKVDDWVVTPRRGKAVELNALWYNALRLLAGWLRDEGDGATAAEMDRHAESARTAFNQRFWNGEKGHLFDVVDMPGGGDDPACRPNQLFAISLEHPVLDRARWEPVLSTVRERLLTPVGLRSLSPDHPDYQETYHGDLRTRDGAYHQGTVWGWLIGPFVDAWLRVHPEDLAGARACLDGLVDHLDDFGVGSIAEVFDAEAPFTPRGCIAQAWSVAELLRCLLAVQQPTASGGR